MGFGMLGAVLSVCPKINDSKCLTGGEGGNRPSDCFGLEWTTPDYPLCKDTPKDTPSKQNPYLARGFDLHG